MAEVQVVNWQASDWSQTADVFGLAHLIFGGGRELN